MADVLRIKRRSAAGAGGAPASLFASELAYNERTDVLYYGSGNSGGLATAVVPIAGPGAFLPLIGGTVTGGIDFGSSLAAGGPTDLSRHISLFGGNYGFSITGARLNIVSATGIWFVSGGNDKVTINSNGLTMWSGSLLTLAQDPTGAMQAATRQYVDANPGEAPNNAYPYARKALAWATVPDYTRIATDQAFDLNSISGSFGNPAGPFTGYQGVYAIVNQTAGLNFPPGVTAAAVLNVWGSNSGWVNQLSFSTQGLFHRSSATQGTFRAWEKVITDAGGTFSGVVSGLTAAPGTNNTQFATTAYVTAADIAAAGVTSFNTRAGAITLTNADVTGVLPASSTNPLMDGTVAIGTSGSWARADHVHPTDTSRAPLASPTFTGTPAAPTATAGTSTTQLATTAFVSAAFAAGVTSFNTRTGAITLTNADVTGVLPASSTNPLMDGTVAIGTSGSWARADHVHPTDTSRAPLASPTFTGTPAAPTATAGTSTTQLATTAFVSAAFAASVTSFNTRTGAITLTSADVSGASGLLTSGGQVVTGNFTIGTNTIQPVLVLNGPNNVGRVIRFQTAGVSRWQFQANSVVEAGSNVGSDLDLYNYDDSGTLIMNPAARFTRATGMLTLFGGLLIGATANISLGTAVVTTTTDLSRHIALYGTSYGFGMTSGRMNIVAPTAVFVSGGTDVATFTSTGITANTPSQPLGSETNALANTLFVARNVGAFVAIASGDADATWTSTQMNARILNVSGAMTADRTFTVPLTGQQKNWLVRNGTTGGFNVIVTTGTSSFSIPPAYATEFWTNGVSLFATHTLLCPVGSPLRIGDATRNALVITPNAALTGATTIGTTGSGVIQLLGGIIAPTPATADNSTTLATTAFVKAQAYAPLASPTFTGTATLPIANATALHETAVAMPANNIDCNAGDFFTKTIAVATTFTVSNVPASGLSASFVLELTNGGAFAITWWANVRWPGGAAPTLTAAGVDVLGFYTINAGTTWRGMLLAKDVK